MRRGTYIVIVQKKKKLKTLKADHSDTDSAFVTQLCSVINEQHAHEALTSWDVKRQKLNFQPFE